MKDVELVLLDESHLEMVRGWRNSTDVSANMYFDNEISKEQQLSWFESIKDDPSSVHWLVYFRGEPVGLAYLTDINKVFSSCFFGFYLKDATVRGGSIGAKLEFNLLQYVFTILRLNKLRCEVFDFNHAVVSMHEKFGFRREAYYRNHCVKNGIYENVVGLAILASEWKVLSSVIGERIYGKKYLK